MKSSEIRQMNTGQLHKKMRELRDSRARKSFHLATGQDANSAALKGIKKDIARVKTELRVRDISPEKQ